MPISPDDSARPGKRIRPNRPVERAGIRAVTAIFEDANMLVQHVDGSLDVGKDLYVDLTENDRATGELVALQVKAGRSYRRAKGFAIPASPDDIALWAASTVPVFGIVHDPDANRLHWTNLTAWARGQPPAIHKEAFVESTWALDERTLPQFIAEVRQFTLAAGPPALIGLADSDPDVQLAAVSDAFALGRRDARALLMLRASLRYLSDRPLRYAIHVLTLCVGHGDVFWHAGNWIDESIRAAVRPELSWTDDELVLLLSAPEPDEYGRGGLGQDVAALVDHSWAPDVNHALERIVMNAGHDAAWPALMLLVSDAGEEGLVLFDRLVPSSPALRNEEHVAELRRVLVDYGYTYLW
jgi:Domain of unknown function (DUF4365)